MITWIYQWLADAWNNLSDNYDPVWDTLDIVLVSLAVYWLLLLIKGTRAAQMSLGVLTVVLVWLLAEQLELATLGFILDNFLRWGVLIVIVIFQHDIRRALARMGRGFLRTAPRQQLQSIEEIVQAVQSLGQRRVGALLVMEREVSLEDHLELGTHIDAAMTRDLLIALFLPYSPLHDGAVVIREGRVVSARCILPLGLSSNLPAILGTRHRAAVGITEETDAIAIVVSEETGRISLVAAGTIEEALDGPQLRQRLLRLTGHIREPEAPALPVEESAAQSPKDPAGGQKSPDPVSDPVRVPEPSS
ncbi:MAG: TIGR00159 family protein [Myxococcales bacterium]|nr:TIGR00159 family protein [Myxococcales bacterium]